MLIHVIFKKLLFIFKLILFLIFFFFCPLLSFLFYILFCSLIGVLCCGCECSRLDGKQQLIKKETLVNVFVGFYSIVICLVADHRWRHCFLLAQEGDRENSSPLQSTLHAQKV